MVKLTEVLETKENHFKFLKGFFGAFRLMHFLPVLTTTTIGLVVTLITLKGESTFPEFFNNLLSVIIPIIPIIFLVLTIFFQQGFLGIQNDYIDREIDLLYNKNKTLTDGWVTPKFAFWWGTICFLLFTGCSIVVGFWSKIRFWTIIYVQGANLIGIFYNLYAKHKPFSILPYMFGFPLIPAYVWTTFGGFRIEHLWIIPLLMFVSFPAHIANEIPDFDMDLKYENKNFAVFLGKKLATIIYWLGILLIEIELVIVYILYNLNTWIFVSVFGLSLIVGIVAFILLWKRNWHTDLLIFNVVTICIGVEVIGFFILFTV